MAVHNPVFRALRWLANELGLQTMRTAGKDVYILILARYLRLFAYGAVALIFALYFEELGFSDSQIGLFMTLTLLGDVFVSLLLTLVADSLGRRKTLFLGAISMAVSGAVFALTSNYIALLFAAIIGVISPTGNEIGPFRAIEESTLAHLVQEEKRSQVFTWYVVLAVLGTSSGLIVGGLVVDRMQSLEGWSELDAYRAMFWVYTALGLVKAAMTLFLSYRCEHGVKEDPVVGSSGETEPLLNGHGNGETDPVVIPVLKKKPKWWDAFSQISKPTRWTLLKLCSVFFLDSLGSGMVPFSLINFYLERKFDLEKGKLGAIMSATWYVLARYCQGQRTLKATQVHLNDWQRFLSITRETYRPHPGYGGHTSAQLNISGFAACTAKVAVHNLSTHSTRSSEQHGPSSPHGVPLHGSAPTRAYCCYGRGQHSENTLPISRTMGHGAASGSRTLLGRVCGSRVAQGHL